MTEAVVEESEVYTKIPRSELVELLRMRDGDNCQYPGCSEVLNFELKDGPGEVTIDHHMPQSWCKLNGWTMVQIWDLDNLRLMTKKCNAKKSDRIPNADGTLPERAGRTWKNRRDKRVNRPEVCVACNAGRDLSENEFCRSCGSGPMPARLPRWRQVKPSECDHDDFFCWACHLSPELRKSALMSLISGSESSEYDEEE